MSLILPLLFNRYVFLICAVLIVVALVGAGKLIWSKYTIGGLLALALGIGAWTGIQKWESSIRANERAMVVYEYNDKIDAMNLEAAKVLAKAIADTEAAQTALRELTVNMEKQREISQAQNAADLRARRAGPRLQFATKVERCGPSGGATQGEAPKPASDSGTAIVQLPEPLNGAVLDYSADAQSLNIDYKILYQWANNPALVCELRAP